MESGRITYLTSDVAKHLDCTTDYVRVLERTGQLQARKTQGGVRLFDRGDVERFAAERLARAKARSRR